MPSGMNEMSHHALSTSSRIVDDICGSQCACVRVPTTTRSPASDAPATVAKYTSARMPSYASRSARSTFA